MRLINGDELIVEYMGEEDEDYLIHNPMIVDTRINGETGAESVVLSKYSIFSADDVKISKKHVLTITPVDAVFQRYYSTSVVYNKKYIDGPILTEMGKINDSMDKALEANTNMFDIAKYDYVHKATKTVH